MRLAQRVIRATENTPIRDMKGRILGSEAYRLAKQLEKLRKKQEETCKHGDTWWPGCCAGVK